MSIILLLMQKFTLKKMGNTLAILFQWHAELFFSGNYF